MNQGNRLQCLRSANHHLVVAVALCLTVHVAPLQGQVTSPSELVLMGTLGRELRESSGLVASRHHPGVLWTHNDSGGDPAVYAISLRGVELAVFRVRHARNRDWEDIAIGPCLETVRDTDCLYIADTGDNAGRRSSVDLYIVTEPQPPDTSRRKLVRGDTERASRVRLAYRRGPTDVEALAVSPGGDAVLVSKGRDGRIDVFQIDRRSLQIAAETGDPITLRSSGSLAIPTRSIADLVTGAAYSRSGARLVVRTYRDLYFYRRANGGFQLDGSPCRVGAVEPQGEAVDFLTEDSLVLGSEGLGGFPATLYRVKCE